MCEMRTLEAGDHILYADTLSDRFTMLADGDVVIVTARNSDERKAITQADPSASPPTGIRIELGKLQFPRFAIINSVVSSIYSSRYWYCHIHPC